MELLLLIPITFIASVVGTLTGFGTSTLMVPVLSFFFPLPIVLLFVGIIHWFGDIWKMLLFREGIRWRLIFLFGIPAIVGSYAGASFVLDISEDLLLRMLGGLLIFYAGFILFIHQRFRIPEHSSTALLGGMLSGFSMGMFGFGGEIRSLCLSAFRLPKAVYISTIGAIAFVTDLTRIAIYYLNGVQLSESLLISLFVLIPISFIGAKFAQRIITRISEHQFRTVVMIALFFIGVKLLIAP